MSNEDNYDARAEIKKLQDNFYQPDKFAKTFCEAAKTQKSIDLALRKIIKKLIKDDPQTVEALKKHLRDINKEDWKTFIKKIGISGWSIIMASIGAIMATILRKFVP